MFPVSGTIALIAATPVWHVAPRSAVTETHVGADGETLSCTERTMGRASVNNCAIARIVPSTVIATVRSLIGPGSFTIVQENFEEIVGGKSARQIDVSDMTVLLETESRFHVGRDGKPSGCARTSRGPLVGPEAPTPCDLHFMFALPGGREGDVVITRVVAVARRDPNAI